MALKKVKGVREKTKVGVVRNEEGGKEPFYIMRARQEGIECSFTQYYYWTLGLLCRLSPCESDLAQYLSINMDKSNTILFLKDDKKRFCEEMVRKDGSAKYTIRTVDNALLELKEIGLIRDFDKTSRGRFVVNPKYFFKDNADKRLEMIKMEIKFGRGGKPEVNIEAK